MPDEKTSEITVDAIPALTDRILTLEDPTGTPITKMTVTDDILALNDARTKTLTNTTFDANGTGNSITNIENADISASAAIALSKLATDPLARANHTGTQDASTTLTGQVAIANGGTGAATAQAAIDALSNVAAATNEHVLTKDTATGNAIFKATAASGSQTPWTSQIDAADNNVIQLGYSEYSEIAVPGAPAANESRLYAVDNAGTTQMAFRTNTSGNTPLIRGCTYFVAANDASVQSKATADYVCDGTADEVQIQAALDALSSTYGGRVLLSEGTFNIAASIDIDKSYITVEGQGDSTIIDCTGMADSNQIFDDGLAQSDSTDYNIGDVAKDATSVILDTAAEDVNFTVGDYVKLCTTLYIDTGDQTNSKQGDWYKITSISSGTLGIWPYALEAYSNTPTLSIVDVKKGLKFRNMRLRDTTADGGRTTQANGQGIYLRYTDGAVVENVTFDGLFRGAIVTKSVLNTRISHCKIYDMKVVSGGNLHYGLELYSGTNMIIDGCTFYNCRHSVSLGSSGASQKERGYQRNTIVSNCTSYMATSGHYDTHQGVIGCTFVNCTAAGWRLIGSQTACGFQARSSTKIIGCTVSGVNNQGVTLFNEADWSLPGASGSHIINCNFYDTNEGVQIGEGVSDILIQGNLFDGCTDSPIEFDSSASRIGGSRTIIQNNTFRNGATGHATIRLDSSLDVWITGNYINGGGNSWIHGDSTFGTATGIASHNRIFGAGNETGTLTGIVFKDNTGADTPHYLMQNRWETRKGSDVASADAITLSLDGNVFDVTGTTTINHINNTGWQDGSQITLQFDGSLTVTHNAGSPAGAEEDIFLAGAANFSATAGDMLTLVLHETGWREISRSVI